MKTSRTSLLTACCLILTATLAADTLRCLVREGTPNATIVLGKRPTTPAQFAAQELQHHLKLISGATVPIVSEGKPTAGIPIYIGDTHASQQQGLKGEDFKLDESLVKFTDKAIFLIGQDLKIYAKPVYGTLKNIPSFYRYHKGSLYATYNFLERYLGVRWYAPTEMGTAYVPRKTVTVTPKDLRQQPAMLGFRRAWMPTVYEIRGKQFSDYDKHLLKLRWRDSFNYGFCNHNVYSVWYKYWDRAKDPTFAKFFVEKRPQYFAQGYKGKSDRYLVYLRNQYPNDNDLPPQLCNSNPDVIQHFAQEAVDKWNGTAPARLGAQMPRFKGQPWFYPIEPDDNNGFCLCPKCQNLFKDKWKDGQRPTNYIHFDWIGKIATAAAAKNPNINISTLAYNNSLHYPKGLDIPKNVGIQMCVMPYDFWAEFGGGAKDYQDWVDHGEPKKRMMSIWTYVYSGSRYAMHIERHQYFFPMFAHAHIARLFKKFAQDGMQGWFGETVDEVGAPFWHGQLENYLCYKMADDPTLDAQQLIDEFFTLYYGNAAEPMKNFYNFVEYAVWTESKDCFKDKVANGRRTRVPVNEELNWGKLGTRPRMNKLATYIAQAKKLVKTPQEKHRLNWFLAGVWEPMLKGRANYEKKQQFKLRPVQKMTVKRIQSANGKPQAISWQDIPSAQPFLLITGFPTTARQTLKLAHDGTFLYLSYHEPGDATKLKSLNSIWGGDDIELLFSADGQRPYTQIAVTPAGVSQAIGYYDENMVQYSHVMTNPATIQSQATADGWNLFLAIPLKDIIPGKTVKPGQTIRFNCFRARHKMASLAWSPTYEISFHVLNRMGTLKLD